MARIHPTLGPPSVILGLHTLCNANRPKSSQVSFNLLFFFAQVFVLVCASLPASFLPPARNAPDCQWSRATLEIKGQGPAGPFSCIAGNACFGSACQVVARGRRACSAEYVMLHRVLRAPRHVHVTSQLGTLHLDVVSGLTFFSLWSCSYETETLKSLLPLLSAATKSTPIGYPVEKDCPLIITPFVCKPSIMPFPASSSFV